jgi:hypothetical protein
MSSVRRRRSSSAVFRGFAILRDHPEAQRHQQHAGNADRREEQQESPGRSESAQRSGVHRSRILRNPQQDDCHEIVTRHHARNPLQLRVLFGPVAHDNGDFRRNLCEHMTTP